MRSQFQVREKSEKDLVTDADDAAQVEIARALHEAFPDHGFLGEEGSLGVSPQQLENNRSSPFCWVVDPLDGTTNYAHGLPQFAVSIALTYQDLPVVGVVLDPSSDECFSAARGLGARQLEFQSLRELVPWWTGGRVRRLAADRPEVARPVRRVGLEDRPGSEGLGPVVSQRGALA